MYMTALPAGSYRGVGSIYASRQGAMVPALAARRSFARVGIQGLGGLGEVSNPCTDPGANMAMNLIQTGTALIGGILGAAGSGSKDATVRDVGTAIGTGGSALGTAWASACMGSTAGATTGAATPTESIEDVMARAQAQMQADAATARSAELDLQLRQQREAQAQQQTQQRNLLLFGGLAVAAVVGVLLLRR